ncbi:hypothetical protein J6590_013874 [Homalodisca vitripennis]|nr:hypothetical protein J6590_013874 [Homalodisca vitripennis]
MNNVVSNKAAFLIKMSLAIVISDIISRSAESAYHHFLSGFFLHSVQCGNSVRRSGQLAAQLEYKAGGAGSGKRCERERRQIAVQLRKRKKINRCSSGNTVATPCADDGISIPHVNKR